MRIIPVIDIVGGEAVHAIGGQRGKYKPLKSVLTKSTYPPSVAGAFKRLGLEELYIADLDAISSGRRNPELIGRIAEGGMKLMVDAGFRRDDNIGSYVKSGVNKIVLATETLKSLNEVSKVVADYGIEVVASIDVKFDQVIGESAAMRLPIIKLVEKFEAEGASEILLLSLDRVGTARGPNHAILKDILNRASVPVLIGGGIRDIRDIKELRGLGVSGVLVATALHRGIITKEELNRLQQMR